MLPYIKVLYIMLNVTYTVIYHTIELTSNNI